MPVFVIFLIFIFCLLIAIPISISLGIVAVLPGAFDPSFTASGSYVIRSMLGGMITPRPPATATIAVANFLS